MPRFFTNVRTSHGDLVSDLEGEEFGDLEECWADALETAADLLAKSRGLDWRGCAFEVMDEQGGLVLTVPFSEASQPKTV